MNIGVLRKYGVAPYNVVVVHGGPGAGGEMAPVAKRLSGKFGVLEPIQTALSIEGQTEDLRKVIEENAEPPVILVGYSWGAWLSYIFAAAYPEEVKKLILLSSGPFESEYVEQMKETRRSRFSEKERDELHLLELALDDPEQDKADAFRRFGEIYSKADSYDVIEDSEECCQFRPDIYNSIWPEANELRASGKLLEFAKHIKCPVAAIHGDYDPHPAEGVEKPLVSVLSDFKFILLERCGHKLWAERQARETFFRKLEEELVQ